MLGRRYSPPSSSALVAFECAARHCNFSRAAEELNTSQSAISRHIAGLEERLGVALFLRRKKGLRLTGQGDHFYRSVVSALENIKAAEKSIAISASRDQLTITCTHSISHLYIMPRFDALNAALGPNIEPRVLVTEYDQQPLLSDDDVDMRFMYSGSNTSATDLVRVSSELVTPVCSGHFYDQYRDIMSGPVSEWHGLPLLDISKPNRGWSTWQDFSTALGMPGMDQQSVRTFSNYVYLLEAAASGQGLALGWSELIGRYLESGTLIAPTSYTHRTDHGLFVRLTRLEPKRRICETALTALAPRTGEV